MEKKVKNAREAVLMAKTDYLPSLSFILQYDLNDKDLWNQYGESWTMWGILHLNFFDGLKTSSKVREAKKMFHYFSALQEELRNQIELEVRESYHNLKEAEERIRVSSEAVAHAEESLRIVEER